MTKLTKISTEAAPKAIGPYSQAMQTGNLLFMSGQIAIDPATNEFIAGDITEQTTRALANLEGVVKAAGGSLANIVKINIYISDINLYAQLNEVYAEFFADHKPARAVVEVSGLPKGALVEIEAIAAL